METKVMSHKDDDHCVLRTLGKEGGQMQSGRDGAADVEGDVLAEPGDHLGTVWKNAQATAPHS
jgi:hypothetical protein